MNKEFSYKIEYEVDKKTEQVIATIPELNHVSSFGDSFAEAEANVKEAALGYLEVLVKDNKEIPKPVFHTEGTYIKLFIPVAIAYVMGRLLPTSAKKVVQKLKKAGFYETHQRGSHLYLVNKEGNIVTVPIGTLYNIVVRQAGLSIDEFNDL